MKKKSALLTMIPALVLVTGLSSAGLASGFEVFLSTHKESEAYKQFEKRPKTELSKLIYLMDRFRSAQFLVVYDGSEYDSTFALNEAKKYIARNYHQEKAESWIREHAYRSNPGGIVIYLKAADDEMQPLRDILLAELEMLS